MVVGSVISELDEDTSLKVMTDQVTQASLLVGSPGERLCKVNSVRTHLRLRHVLSCGMRPVAIVKYSDTRKGTI